MAHFGPYEDVIAYGPNLPDKSKGQAAVRAYFAGKLKDVRSIDATVTDFRVVTDGAMAAILSRQNLVMRMADGTTRRESVRQSACLRRANSKWFAMMEATSFPVDLAKGTVVTDLTAAP